jgi:hypothetical protein
MKRDLLKKTEKDAETTRINTRMRNLEDKNKESLNFIKFEFKAFN